MKYFSLLFALVIAACGGSTVESTETVLSYEEKVLEWREGRLERLRGETGYLNLVGLFWLSEGESTFGSGEGNALTFPRSGYDRIGTFERQDDGVLMTVADGVDVVVNGEAVQSIFMPDDTGEEQYTASLGTLSWTVINRDNKIAIRLRDSEAPALQALPAIPYFDIDQKWQVDAKLTTYEEPRVISVGTVVEGLGWNPTSPGFVEFEIDGEQYSLEGYDSGERIFFVFGDRTSGKETYPAGRFLYADKPLVGDRMVLDFNESYNPPCAFSDFSTCPVATPRNRLPLRITAGEKYIDSLHVAAAD